MLSKYGIIIEADKERGKREFPGNRRDLDSPLIMSFAITIHKCQPTYAVLLSQEITVMHGLARETPFDCQSSIATHPWKMNIPVALNVMHL